MSVKTLSSLVEYNLNKMAPDLTFLSDRATNTDYITVASIDCSGALTTVLSLTGKYLINSIYVDGMSTTDIDQWKLTVDGVVIHNTDGMTRTFQTMSAFGQVDGDGGSNMIICDSSFLLEIEMATDNAINLYYRVRPIL